MISIVIPCYRSEDTLEQVVLDAITELNQKPSRPEIADGYEIICVCDGSPDNVWEVIRRLSSEHRGIVRGILFAKNFGQHAALLAGYKASHGEIVISMDDDGQADPAGLWPLIDKVAEGYDVVYARYPEHKESAFRRFGSAVDKWMQETFIGKPKNVKGTSYFALRRFVVEEMVRYENSYPYIGGLVYRTTKNIGEVEIEHRERSAGTSGYSLGKLLRLWINGFTAFSEKPLRIATFLGIFCALVGFVAGIVTVIRKLVNPSIQLGYSSLMAVNLFVGGIIMLLLGIIGEYIGRIYISINNAPQYVIKEEVFDESR